MSTYTPIFTTYTEEDVLLIEREREKDSKRKKRGTRARRGVLLPDREPVKTHRTLLNPLGANGLLPPRFEDLTPTLQHTGHGSRRAAAIAAQANINLIAQDLPIPEKAPPSPAPVFVSKRGRGFKRGGLSRASPAGGREGSHLHEGLGTPTTTTIQIPVLPNLKRPHEETMEDSPMSRKRSHHQSPERHPSEDVKPIIIPSLPHPTISRSRLNGSIASGSRSGDSKSRSPEKRRGSTPKVPRRRLQDDDDDDDDSDSDTSDSSEDEYGSRGRRGSKSHKKKSRGSTSTTRRPSVPAPITTLPQIPPPSHQATTTASAMPPRPEWFERADGETKSRYPKDKFMVVPKGKPEPGKEVEWRLRCVDWYVSFSRIEGGIELIN
jgi:SWI/SNF-related matrix-associated actin-dependent regulator of chromatin subfamily B protein 1